MARIEGPLKNDVPFNLSPESETYVFYSRDDRTYFVLRGGGGANAGATSGMKGLEKKESLQMYPNEKSRMTGWIN